MTSLRRKSPSPSTTVVPLPPFTPTACFRCRKLPSFNLDLKPRLVRCALRQPLPLLRAVKLGVSIPNLGKESSIFFFDSAPLRYSGELKRRVQPDKARMSRAPSNSIWPGGGQSPRTLSPISSLRNGPGVWGAAQTVRRASRRAPSCFLPPSSCRCLPPLC